MLTPAVACVASCALIRPDGAAAAGLSPDHLGEVDMRRAATIAAATAALGAVLASTADAAPPEPPVAGKRTFVVLYKQGASFSTAQAAIRRAGGRIVRENRAVGLATVVAPRRGFAARVRAERALAGAARNSAIGDARDRLHRRHQIERGGEDGLVAAVSEPVAGEPLAALQWDMQMIDATPAGSYAVQQGTHDVLVGNIDTGIDGSHPDLAPNFDATLSRNFTVDIPLVDGPCEEDPDGSCVDPANVDEDGHGTHTAGTIAAAANGLGIAGVAPGVGLVNLRAGQDSGFFFLQPTVDAITYAA
jgi:lantibiotic leader peptide-processing serine protease